MRAGARFATATWALLAAASPAASQVEGTGLEARVWLDRGQEPVLRRGEQVRVYYRASEDAFVAILHIDTDGTTRLVFPRTPDENHYVRGGRDYQVIFPSSPYWNVDDSPGMGYFFIVVAREPFDFSALRYSSFTGGWDMSAVGEHVYTDPYVAVDDFVSYLIPDWEFADYALDFTSYHVEQRQQFPRFLCYECHGFRPYSAWNPYAYTCTTFRVVIYDDPYYYPSQRYRGSRVVYARPPAVGVPRYQFKERALGEVGTPDVRTRTPAGRRPLSAAPPEVGRGRMAVPRGRAPTDPRRGRMAWPRADASPAGGRVALPRRDTGAGAARPSDRRPAVERRTPRTRTGATRVTPRPSQPPTTRPRPEVSRPSARIRRPATGSSAQRPHVRTSTPAQRARPRRAQPSKPKAGARRPARSGGSNAKAAPRRAPPRKPPARASSSGSARKPVKRRGGRGSG